MIVRISRHAGLAMAVCGLAMGCRQPPAPAAASSAQAPDKTSVVRSTSELLQVLASRPRTGAASSPAPAAAQRGDSVSALLTEAVSLANSMKKLDEEYAELTPKIKEWQQRYERHEANRCLYPEGQPEACAAYDREAGDLDRERDVLRTALEGNEKQYQTATESLGRLKPRLRVAAILEGGCARCTTYPAGSKEAEECLHQCFDGVDSRLRSCLGPATIEVFAACLRR
jgi:hypothetical protein